MPEPKLSQPTLERPRKVSQRERILFLLSVAPVCGTTLLSDRIPRYAARIWELRGVGFDITTRKCTRHKHTTRQVEYVLE
jgi:hypothetical protein